MIGVGEAFVFESRAMKTLFGSRGAGWATAFFAGVISAASVSSFAVSAEDAAKKDPAACLQASRLWSFNVLDQRTVVLGDRDNNKFTVHMTGGCIGLTNIIDDLRVVTKTNLGCLTQGDRIAFREPTLGRMSCFVTSVEPQKQTPKS